MKWLHPQLLLKYVSRNDWTTGKTSLLSMLLLGSGFPSSFVAWLNSSSAAHSCTQLTRVPWPNALECNWERILCNWQIKTGWDLNREKYATTVFDWITFYMYIFHKGFNSTDFKAIWVGLLLFLGFVHFVICNVMDLGGFKLDADENNTDRNLSCILCWVIL